MSEFKYVPVEPTDEMLNSGADSASCIQGANHMMISKRRINAAYRAMLAAAPTQPSPAESDKKSSPTETFLCDKDVMKMAVKTIADAHTDIRNAALDDAANLCDGRFQSLHRSGMHSEATEANKCSMAILSLKSQPAQPDKSSSWVTPEPNPNSNSTVYQEGWDDACEACERLNRKPAQPSDSRTEFSDTEMLDWLIDKEYAVRLIGGVYDLFDDSGEWLNVDRPTAREAIKAAMRADQET